MVAQPKGGASFDIGRLTPEAQAKVPLTEVKPLFLMTSFQDERRMRDTLGLQKAVEEALRTVASRGREAPLVFVEAREMPGAFEIAGRYRVKDGRVMVTAALFRGEEEVATFTLEGPESDLPGLAERIVEQARNCIPR